MRSCSTHLEQAPVLLQKFARSLEAQGRSPLTLKNYLRGVRFFLEYVKESEEKIKDFREIDRALLTRYQAFLFKGPKRYRLTTQMGLLIAVRNFFAGLEKEGLLLSNPACQIELPKKPRTLPLDTLSEKEMKRLLAAVDLEKPLGVRDRAILELLYSTGIRAGELARLRISDLDETNAALRIREGKGKSERVVPIGEVALRYVTLYLAEERPRYLGENSGEVLFLSRKGRAMSAANPAMIVKTYARSARIRSSANAHMIRRSCATHMLRRNAPIRYLQELLGHRSLDTTVRYTQVVIRDLQRIHRKTHPRECD